MSPAWGVPSKSPGAEEGMIVIVSWPVSTLDAVAALTLPSVCVEVIDGLMRRVGQRDRRPVRELERVGVEDLDIVRIPVGQAADAGRAPVGIRDGGTVHQAVVGDRDRAVLIVHGDRPGLRVGVERGGGHPEHAVDFAVDLGVDAGLVDSRRPPRRTSRRSGRPAMRRSGSWSCSPRRRSGRSLPWTGRSIPARS